MRIKHKIAKYFLLVFISFCAGLAGAISLYHYAIAPHLYAMMQQQAPQGSYTAYAPPPYAPAAGSVSFVRASEVARPCVVYIKVMSQGQQQSDRWDPFWDFFGNVGPVSSSGSGVIISSDGFIITNSHVVKGADKIEVVMNNNKRSFAGKVVGVDPSTDLALVKIEAKDLPSISFANSDDLPIGDWVMAVGNPFNLTSTVTAGIVSAKGRNINLVQNQFPIESFIQTDAAINPGNSGGALVNLDGKLVGINTAILSKTGSYSGYGFAIPSNIVRKVVKDLKEYGFVHRAFLEADVVDIDETVLTRLPDENINGVYARDVAAGGNAEKAGLKAGDLILKVDDNIIDSRAEYDQQLAYHRPGDAVKLVIKRGKNVKEVTVTLTNLNGTTSMEKKASVRSNILGADFEAISKIEKEKYHADGGIRISNIGSGQLRNMNLPEGFIIISFNGHSYSDPNELAHAMEHASGQINISGITPEGMRSNYSFYTY